MKKVGVNDKSRSKNELPRSKLWELKPKIISYLRIEFYAKWIEFMGEQDIDPDQTGHLQNFENSFWFRLVRVGL
jgi:hypothetical protein